jgi:hypothetical protein
MEKAYKRISFNEALNMLNLKKPEDLLQLASQVSFGEINQSVFKELLGCTHILRSGDLFQVIRKISFISENQHGSNMVL